MSEAAELLYARADETARANIAMIIKRHGMDPDDPEVRAAVEGTLYGALTELERGFKHIGIALLDTLPVLGPWMLQRLAHRP